jgi:hypothetical protein
MAELSNNPFIDHTSSALSRFPNINTASSSPAPPSAPQYSTPSSWPQQQQQQQQLSPGYIGASPTGYTQQQQYFQQPQQWPQQQQQQPQPQHQQQQQHYQPPQMQAPYPPTNFQSPGGTFGQQQQQFAGQINPLATGYPQSQLQGQYADYPTQQTAAASYGYQQQQQQPQQQTGYAGYPSQQQLLAQFDPYVNLGHLSSPGPGPGSGLAASPASSSSMITNGAVGSPPPGVQHPRMFIQTHRVELEAWDPATWKQVQNVFESLKTAWESRKRAAETQVRALGGTVGASSGSATAGFFGGAAPAPGYGAYGAYGAGGYQTPQAQEIDRLNSVLAYLPPLSLCLIWPWSLLQLIKEANSNVGAYFHPDRKDHDIEP